MTACDWRASVLSEMWRCRDNVPLFVLKAKPLGEGFCSALVDDVECFVRPMIADEVVDVVHVEVMAILRKRKARIVSSQLGALGMIGCDGALEPDLCLLMVSGLIAHLRERVLCIHVSCGELSGLAFHVQYERFSS